MSEKTPIEVLLWDAIQILVEEIHSKPGTSEWFRIHWKSIVDRLEQP